jgi:hypothetical protein
MVGQMVGQKPEEKGEAIFQESKIICFILKLS